ncbi:MAG: polyphosphate kinase [Chitinophagaceae bacterium]|nr:polyphosphate kinase [Chitinophagaceae bacterium]
MSKISLQKISTRAPKTLDKEQTRLKTASILRELNELQNLLYAESKHSLLIVMQGMDASGKDGVIRNVMTAMNPQGVTVKSFKVPTAEEAAHDFLWRVHAAVPAKGMIQVFNRSHYEDILVTRVHKWCTDEMAKKRMQAINAFEELLVTHNQTHILKFYLHISPQEQQQRLNERMQDRAKMWKYNEKDFEEAKLWKLYMKMYEECFNKCNFVPWTIVPSDQNWYKEYVIASAMHQLLLSLKMRYPGLKK